MNQPKLTLVLPAHNEAGVIATSVRLVDDYLDRLGIAYRIIVGDSASTDGTGAIVEKLGLPSVDVIRSETSGKGGMLSLCLEQARGEYVGFIDADLEIDVSYVGPMLECLDAGADAVIASKALDPTLNRDRPLSRRMNTSLYNGIVRMLFGTPFRDHQAGLKLFRRDPLQFALPRVSSGAWLWDTELLVALVRDRCEVVEFPIETTPRDDSRFAASGNALGLARELLGLYRRVRRAA